MESATDKGQRDVKRDVPSEYCDVTYSGIKGNFVYIKVSTTQSSKMIPQGLYRERVCSSIHNESTKRVEIFQKDDESTLLSNPWESHPKSETKGTCGPRPKKTKK